LLFVKLVSGKHFPVKEKFGLISRKIFFFYFGWKTLSESCEKFKISYYFLIISNLILKLLIAIIYIYWIFFFQFHPLEFDFYINFDPHFYNFYLLFPYHFLIEILYLSNLLLILLIVIYFIWNNLWNGNYYYFNFFIFLFFLFFRFDLYYLIIIYFIWDNLWNYIFFQFHCHSTF
jgi:hypothetical protein